MALAAVNWRLDQKHKDRPFHDGTFKTWAKEPSTRTPYHYRDGVSVFVSLADLNPDDQFI